MANKRTTLYLHGTIHWAKIFGAPRPNYDGDAREWTFEFEPDEDSLALLEEHGLGDRVKDKSHKKGYENRGRIITLKRGEFRFDGERNEPIRVVDAADAEWTGALVGNGSEVDVKVNVVDYGPRKRSGIYPQAIRVLDLVEFEREEFAPLPKDDKRRQAAEAKRQQVLDDFGDDDEDDVPFEVDADDSRQSEKPKPKGRAKRAEPEKVNLIPDDLDDDIDL